MFSYVFSEFLLLLLMLSLGEWVWGTPGDVGKGRQFHPAMEEQAHLPATSWVGVAHFLNC